MAAKPQASQTRVGGGGSLLRRQAPLFVGALILIGCVAVGMLALDFYLRDIEVDDGLQKAQTLAHILSDQADKALNSGSLVMSKIAEKVRTERVSTTAGLKAIANDPAIVAIASNRATDNNFISTVSILSPDGNILGPGELRPFCRPTAPMSRPPFRAISTARGRSAFRRSSSTRMAFSSAA